MKRGPTRSLERRLLLGQTQTLLTAPGRTIHRRKYSLPSRNSNDVRRSRTDIPRSDVPISALLMETSISAKRKEPIEMLSSRYGAPSPMPFAVWNHWINRNCPISMPIRDASCGLNVTRLAPVSTMNRIRSPLARPLT